MRLFLLLVVMLSVAAARPRPEARLVMAGHLPVLTTDKKGMVHLVFGRRDTLFYTISADQGQSFAPPMVVAHVPQLVLGATRGPQIAAGEKRVLITAVNKAGNIMAYALDRGNRRWSSAVRINDQPDVAKEGFQAVAALSGDRFYAAWLDLRGDHHNKVVGAVSLDGGRSWKANQVVYQSPDQTVCECCRVSVAASGDKVLIMFRNWIGGARDLYLSQSTDGGKTFATAQKLGKGTWKLKACPMDGGGLALTGRKAAMTVWRRESSLYLCQPGEPERLLGPGRSAALAAGRDHWVTAFQKEGVIHLQSDEQKPVELGKGQTPSVTLAGSSVICAWESNQQIHIATLSPF